jgi:hypothetical protein
VLSILGAALGIWIVVRTKSLERTSILRSTALLASAAVAGALGGAGQLYGFALAAAIFLIIYPQPRATLTKPAMWLLPVVAVAVGVALLRGGFRALLEFPYPYALLLTLELPGVCLLFSGAVLWLALRTPRPEDYGLRIAALGVLLPLAALGLSSREPASRFAIGVYPFLLLLVGAALLALLELLRRWSTRWTPKVAFAAALVVVIAGLLGDHGLPTAWKAIRLEHGEPTHMRNTYAFRPDHAGPGRFVRDARGPADVVIAEDVLQQGWYAGRIDYWFRSYEDARAFLYRGRDGREHEHYIGSVIVRDPAVIDSTVASARGRVWFITSGETSPVRSYFLSAEQARWLDSLENTRQPAFVGRDKATRVYCLNCRQ